jgi:predicted DNA-binding transcriptional regulator AlpA
MADSAFFSTEGLAEYLGRPIDTIRRWRYVGDGPPGIRIGRRVMYAKADVEKWLQDRAAEEAR